MKNILYRIKERAVELSKNRLFTSLLERDDVDPRDRLAFAPMAIDFIMGFRDFNKYYIRYPNPRDDLEGALNAHAMEDESHSRLFLEDWGSLGLDEQLGWAPRDLYWWMTCDETAESRRLDFDLTSMAFHHPDPLLRFAIVESMEAAGSVFFTRTAPVAEALAARTRKAYPYFGKDHLDRETGHLQNTDERAFLRAALTVAQRSIALPLVDRVFDVFERHFSRWERFARDVREGVWTFRPVNDARISARLRDDRPTDISRFMRLSHPAGLLGPAAELAWARRRAFEELWQTPFYRWVREAFAGDFKRMARYFLLQWVVDYWTCADYFAFDTTYPDPSSPVERGINRLSKLYASEMNRRYVEWEQLEFDAFTGHRPREALRHYWLDPRVEEHREVFADLRKLTLRYPEPLYRYWIMKCFVRFGDTLMDSLGISMKRAGVRDEDFIAFAGSPERLHPDLPPDPEADRAIEEIEQRPLSPADCAVIREIIRETRDQEARRSAISWRIVEDRYYEELDRGWAARAPARSER